MTKMEMGVGDSFCILEKCHSGKDTGERGELEEGRHDREKVILPSGTETNYHLFILVSCFERWSKLMPAYQCFP